MFKILKVNFQNLKTENTSVNAPALFVKTNFEPGVTAGLVWYVGFPVQERSHFKEKKCNGTYFLC
jgi:hypothetical protein